MEIAATGPKSSGARQASRRLVLSCFVQQVDFCPMVAVLRYVGSLLRPRSVMPTLLLFRDRRHLSFASSGECLFSLFGPDTAGVFALIASELVGHPEQRAVDRGTIIAGQVDDT